MSSLITPEMTWYCFERCLSIYSGHYIMIINFLLPACPSLAMRALSVVFATVNWRVRGAIPKTF